MENFKRTMIKIPSSLHDQIKIMCVLTHKTMSDFIRIAVQDKIKELKTGKDEKNFNL